MSRRYKLTGCARFLFFMIIFIPAVYFGLQYFGKDDDRVQDIKEWVDETVSKAKENDTVEKILKRKNRAETSTSSQKGDIEMEIESLKEELRRQDELIRELRLEIDSLKNG